MKVLLVNGSPNGHGCTYTALKEIEKHCAPRAWKQKCSTLAISYRRLSGLWRMQKAWQMCAGGCGE